MNNSVAKVPASTFTLMSYQRGQALKENTRARPRFAPFDLFLPFFDTSERFGSSLSCTVKMIQYLCPASSGD